ncbi:hypothetical protein [Bacteriophage Eos]|nr:hypothetical protein [Bacteriophage Eos]
MFASIVSAMFGSILLYSTIMYIFVALVVFIALKTRRRSVARVARVLINISLGIFGVFQCDCKCRKRPGYCWMWMELEHCISILFAILTGVVIMGFTLSLIPLMTLGGVTSVVTLYTPVLMYIMYPLILFLVRRKCTNKTDIKSLAKDP